MRESLFKIINILKINFKAKNIRDIKNQISI